MSISKSQTAISLMLHRLSIMLSSIFFKNGEGENEGDPFEELRLLSYSMWFLPVVLNYRPFSWFPSNRLNWLGIMVNKLCSLNFPIFLLLWTSDDLIYLDELALLFYSKKLDFYLFQVKKVIVKMMTVFHVFSRFF